MRVWLPRPDVVADPDVTPDVADVTDVAEVTDVTDVEDDTNGEPPVVLTWGAESLEDLDWGEPHELRLFFPGYANWQWLTDELPETYPHPSRAHEAALATHAGAAGVNSGTACASCHSSTAQLETFGGRIVDLVDDSYAKEGIKDVTLYAAYDDTHFYLRVEYQSQRTSSPSTTHQTFRFDGSSWGAQGGPRDFESGRISEDDLPANGRFDYEDRVALMLNPTDNNIRATPGHAGGFNEFGCWQTCHSPLRRQPLEPDPSDVLLNPYLGGILAQSDIRHYLLGTRDAYDGVDGNWGDIDATYSPEADRAAGYFLDLWQARMARSVPVGHATNDYIMEYRHSNVGGVDPFTDSRPDNNLAGAWIYDPRITGYWAIPEAQFDEWRKMGRGPLITEDVAGEGGADRNGVRFSDLFEDVDGAWVLKEAVQVLDGELVAAGTAATAIFQVGDLLPRRVLRQPTLARADLTTFVRWEDGFYTVIFQRALDTENVSDHPLDLTDGHTLGLAIFDDNVSNRSHFVSMPFVLGIEGSGADLEAREQAAE
jgi:hypothetical protein